MILKVYMNGSDVLCSESESFMYTLRVISLSVSLYVALPYVVISKILQEFYPNKSQKVDDQI